MFNSVSSCYSTSLYIPIWNGRSQFIPFRSLSRNPLVWYEFLVSHCIRYMPIKKVLMFQPFISPTVCKHCRHYGINSWREGGEHFSSFFGSQKLWFASPYISLALYCFTQTNIHTIVNNYTCWCAIGIRGCRMDKDLHYDVSHNDYP